MYWRLKIRMQILLIDWLGLWKCCGKLENSIRIHPSREKPINHRPISLRLLLPSRFRMLPNIFWLEIEKKNLF